MASYYSQQGGQFRVIPGAGTYLEEQNKAQDAYAKAQAQLKAQRAQHQIQSGLGSNWEVDPRAQYGTYQQMLQGQGMALDQSHEEAQQRGFFGAGLGNQGESAVRYGNAVQSLGFQNQLADWENAYQIGLSDVARQKAEADKAALEAARAAAAAAGDYTPGGSYDSSYDSGYDSGYDTGAPESPYPPGVSISDLVQTLRGGPREGPYVLHPGVPTRPKVAPVKARVIMGKGPIINPTRPGAGKAGLAPARRAAPKPAPKRASTPNPAQHRSAPAPRASSPPPRQAPVPKPQQKKRRK